MSMPDEILWAVDAATRAALHSPCAKSKRGVAIFDPEDGSIVSMGWNSPPAPMYCDASESCRRDCSKICNHAEQNAILNARSSLRGYGLVHVKVVNGKVVAGGGPSCWQCSRLVLLVDLAAVWLYESRAAEDTWVKYTAEEFHRATLEHEGLHPAKVKHFLRIVGMNYECSCGWRFATEDALTTHIVLENTGRRG